MGRFGWLLCGIAVLLFLTCVRIHPSEGGWIGWFTVEFVSPFR